MTPLILAASLSFGQAAPEDEAHFENKIRPVLQTCFRCHGARKVKGGLRVDSRAALLKGGRRGPAIVPGKPTESVLIKALNHEGPRSLRMPPGRKLSAEVLADFSKWVKNGAVWPKAPAKTGVNVDPSPGFVGQAFQPAATNGRLESLPHLKDRD